MKTRYLLKKRGGTRGATHPIYIALYEGDQTEIIFTGQRIALKDWSASDKLPKDQSGEVFRQMDKAMKDVNKAKLRLEVNDQAVTPFTVKQAYEKLVEEKKEDQLSSDKKAKAGLKSVYGLTLHYKENLPVHFSALTQRGVKTSLNLFTEYLEKTGQRSIELKDFSSDSVKEFLKYLSDKKRQADSSLNKTLKHLGWLFKPLNVQIDVKPRKLKKKAIVALTVPELRALEEVDITTHPDAANHKNFQRAKDMFLLGCYTALRISDLKRINPVNASDGFFELVTQKNNQVFRMPMVSQAKEILKKYKGRAPKISEQEVNRSIKKVCELAKINKPIEVQENRASKTITKTVPKYELITSHIAGKTFITNAKELWGLEPAEIAGIVRKDLNTLLKHYFKAPVESATLKMLNADRAQMKIA